MSSLARFLNIVINTVWPVQSPHSMCTLCALRREDGCQSISYLVLALRSRRQEQYAKTRDDSVSR